METIINYLKDVYEAVFLFLTIFVICMVATAGIVAGYTYGKEKFLDNPKK